ncbi:MAG: PhzF family phenazine biosynthesis protein [Clostridiales bacterium]|nr:PhzF family phenazine biosynthesis protein [Clostridiales bacterium]
MRFFIVDAFTENIFGGNPAGVVLLDEKSNFPDDSTMLKTAAELRYSETAFVMPMAGNELQIRYFTPAAEVDFCGHATIGTFTVLLKTGHAKKKSSFQIHTLSGDLKIDIAGGLVMMEMPTSKVLKILNSQPVIKELYRSLGVEWSPVSAIDSRRQKVELLPAFISTGFPDIFMPVQDRIALAAIEPDFRELSALTERLQAGGVHAFTLDTPDTGITACCRNFAPLYGIDEEAATGTASGGLTFYLHENGILGGGDCCFLQGESMGRPSMIFSSIDAAKDPVKIKVGGKGAILAEGEIFI